MKSINAEALLHLRDLKKNDYKGSQTKINLLVVRRAAEAIELLREKEFSSLSPDTPLRGGRMDEGLGREERFSGLLVTPS